MAHDCEFESMEYIDENSIDPDLICSICHRALKDPVHTPCDHTYGRACITHWLTNSTDSSCPTCVEAPLLIEDLKPAGRLLTNMLDRIRVRCTLCEETDLQRGNFTDHRSKHCPNALVECQAVDIRCPWKGPRNQLDSHTSVCVFEPLRPVLATLIAENRQLSGQVQNHEHKIKELTKKISQLNNTVASDSEEEGAAAAMVGLTVGDSSRTEDAIYIRNIPSTVEPNELFDLFSKIGRIKYNGRMQKPFILKYPGDKNGTCAARVTFVDKESVTAAIAEFNQKHIPQWNRKIFVSKFEYDANRRKVKDAAQGKNENVGARQNTKAAEGPGTMSGVVNQPQPLMNETPTTPTKPRRIRKPPPNQDENPTNEQSNI